MHKILRRSKNLEDIRDMVKKAYVYLPILKMENTLVDTVEEEEGGMDWESSIETYTLPYAK